MKDFTNKELNEEKELGKMINVWIQHHGSLDLDTPEEKIIEFYKEQTKLLKKYVNNI